MKNFMMIVIGLTTLISCATLHSNTFIKPKDSFILGDNEHRAFKAKLQNVSKNNIEVYLVPNNGGQHSLQIIKPGDKVTVEVDPNTALFIQNNSTDTASVNLIVTGDTGLSMKYKN